MVRQFAAGLLSLILSASVAAAQDTSSGDFGFCATAPQDLLVALDGSWSLTQAAGAMQGQIVVPLPPQPPVTMRLEYDPDQGLTIMSGQGQQILMLPTMTAVDELPEILSSALGPSLESAVSPSGCDFFALPTILGTNVYSLSGGSVANEIIGAGQIDSVTPVLFAFFCLGGQPYVFQQDGDGWAFGELPAESFDFGDAEDFCPLMSPTEGKMKMTIAVKFDSPSSGRGVVAFEGKLEGGPSPEVQPLPCRAETMARPVAAWRLSNWNPGIGCHRKWNFAAALN